MQKRGKRDRGSKQAINQYVNPPKRPKNKQQNDTSSKVAASQTVTAAEDKALQREVQNKHKRNFREVDNQRQQNKLAVNQTE